MPWFDPFFSLGGTLLEKFFSQLKKPAIDFKKATPAVAASIGMTMGNEGVSLNPQIYNDGTAVALDVKVTFVDSIGNHFWKFELQRVDPRENVPNRHGYVASPNSPNVEWNTLLTAKPPLVLAIVYRDDYGRTFKTEHELSLFKTPQGKQSIKVEGRGRVVMLGSPIKKCWRKEVMNPEIGFVG